MNTLHHGTPTLTAVFEPAPEGGFTCSFEELPEVFSEGETLDEARANLLDALELVLSHHREENHDQPAGEATVREIFALQRAA